VRARHLSPSRATFWTKSIAPIPTAQAFSSGQYLDRIKKAWRAAKDAAVLDAHAKHLNAEALDVLEYQNLN
jgi:hypothetical protein